jgi:hypothetical protein
MAESRSKGEERDLLEEGKEAFQAAVDAESDNRKEAVDDINFARLSNQWPEDIRAAREQDNRPCLTRNLMPSFIRQVVNDARQNKPSIKVHPADDTADVQTAEIMNGLIRNIEYTSNAEVAYDTATESAVSMGWGYFKIDYDYAYDDSVDMDITINRVANPFSIYGDPLSMAADSSDWNTAFEEEWLSKDKFEAQFPDEEKIDWDFDFDGAEDWRRDKELRLVHWWQREEVERPMAVLSNGAVVDMAVFEAQAGLYALSGIQFSRLHVGRSYKVKRHLMTGEKVIRTDDWAGKYIPIIPVYGDEVIDENGKRHFISLIRDAKDTQRQYNYWQSTATELVALAPKVPFIGAKGSFLSDAKSWATSNTDNHPYLEYDVVPGAQPPQRQPLDTGAAAGALQQAMTAREDMGAIIGIRAENAEQINEASGRALLVRQRKGDVSTFHFQDNMSRAIRHAGRILIDLIPKVYDAQRVVRIMGEDGVPQNVPLKTPIPVRDAQGQPQTREVPTPDGSVRLEPVTRIYDLTVGKYDLTVSTGPGFQTKREEAAVQMTEYMRVFPGAAPLIGDLVAKNLDWPGAEEIAKRLKTMLPPQLQEGGLPPQVTQMIEQGKQTITQQGKLIEQLQAYILKLESDRTNDARKVDVDMYEAQTDRMEAFAKFQKQGTEVPDRPGPYGDFEGIVAAAEANKLNATAERERANAGLAAAKAIREMQPQAAPTVSYDQDISQMPRAQRPV